MNNFAQKEFYSIVVGSCVLAANAGFINVVTLTGLFSVTVSHVTGNVSKVAIALYNADATNLAVVSSIIFSFMFGSFVAGFMVGDHKFQLGRTYGYALALESFMLFMSLATLRKELIVGEWCAAFACGLQNAIATSYSGAVVRTTHMTGICTDIGNILGQACRTDSNAELWRLKVHIPILFSFCIGGAFGEVCYQGMGEHSLLIPCIFTGLVAVTYLSLPFINMAQVSLAEATRLNKGSKPTVEVRYLGDPSKPDRFASLRAPSEVETDLKNLRFEIGDASDLETPSSSTHGVAVVATTPRTAGAVRKDGGKEEGKRESVVRTASFKGEDYSGVAAGGSVEVLYTSATPSSEGLP
ncbi:hypothetical protein HK101_007327 [Irineochytrium annulatum]|nr:hypothetical protein HK101_007327 [Irineochytrium annulatum]